MRWSVWARNMTGDRLVSFVRDEVFPFFGEVAQSSAMNFMEGARLGIDEPVVLAQVLTLIDGLRLDRADADVKGDLFEHILRQIKQAGELGQFRTPRHVIRAIVRMLDPKIGETIYDPAAGTAGFLVAAYDHIRLANSSPDGIEETEVDGKPLTRGIGDRLSDKQIATLRNATFYGNDVDPKMVRLATMNLTLRGLGNVRIMRRNALTETFDREKKHELGLPIDGFDVILANPPFSGRLDPDRIVDAVKVGNTAQTELLFLAYMLAAMKEGGRMGVIVPEGVLFGSTGAHKELRRRLLDLNTVEAVVSLPAGAFQPYSGVKTAALILTKGGRTERVMFLDCQADGYKLDAQHDTPIEADDLPGLVAAYQDRKAKWRAWEKRNAAEPWTERFWFATAADLRAHDLSLSAAKYKPHHRVAADHRPPTDILAELKELHAEIAAEMDTLEAQLAEMRA
jgi:type I restriction enzyme M protein